MGSCVAVFCGVLLLESVGIWIEDLLGLGWAEMWDCEWFLSRLVGTGAVAASIAACSACCSLRSWLGCKRACPELEGSEVEGGVVSGPDPWKVFWDDVHCV